MQFGDFKIHLIRECTFKLDGGAMFGVVPKSLWNKVLPSDDFNRVPLACNLLLIETGKARVLVETGMGARWNDRDRERYEIKSLINHENFLESVGLTNDDVDAVVISHLHFDHAGGAILLKDRELVPAFPNAKYYVQKGEWEFAHAANARARASYRAEDFEGLLSKNVLVLMDGDSEIVEGVNVHVTGGHTSHHQVITWNSSGQSGVYFADIIPTKNHLSPPWVMGYDHYPLQSCDFKSEWLSQAAREEWLVVFDHEIDVPWGHVKQTNDNKFQWHPLAQETLLGSNLEPK